MPPPLIPTQATRLPPLTPAQATGTEKEKCQPNVLFKKPQSYVRAKKLVNLQQPVADATVSKKVVDRYNHPLTTFKNHEEKEQFWRDQEEMKKFHQNRNETSSTFTIDYLLSTNRNQALRNHIKELRDVKKNFKLPVESGTSANFSPANQLVDGNQELQTVSHTKNGPMYAIVQTVHSESAVSLPKISQDSANSSQNSSHDECRRRDGQTYYRESMPLNPTLPDSAMPCLQEQSRNLEKDIICLSQKEKTTRVMATNGQTEGGPRSLPLKRSQELAIGRHRMPQAPPAPPSNVMTHSGRKNAAREHSHEYPRAGSSNDQPQSKATAHQAQMASRPQVQNLYERQIQHHFLPQSSLSTPSHGHPTAQSAKMTVQPRQTPYDFLRPCAPSKPSQGHPNAQSAEKTVQPTPLLQNENTASRTRNLPDVQVLGAHYTVNDGMLAAERAAAIAMACATTVDTQATSTTIAGSAKTAYSTNACSPISPAQRKPLRKIRPKVSEINYHDPWWQNHSLSNKAQYANMHHQNDPDLPRPPNPDEIFFHDTINSEQVQMKDNGEQPMPLDNSHHQDRNLKPFNSDNPAFKSSFVDYYSIHAQKPRVYICIACDHESKTLSNFKAHHRTRRHQDYLNAWNHEQDKMKLIIQDQPQSKRAKTMTLNKQKHIAPTE